MWKDRQFELLRKEIEEALSPLSNSVSLCNLAKETLALSAWDLWDRVEHSRPWPLLPLMVCESISGHYEQALPAAAAFQFLKEAAEVFDDIEDADSSGSLSAKYGNAIAVNAATTLLILAESAVTRLVKKGIDGYLAVRVMESINSHYTTACAGQHMDLSLTPGMVASEEMYLNISDMKSASVTECACQVGAMLATADRDLIDKFTVFGHNLGMAAQIANDIQGVTGGIDIQKRKITLPAIFALVQTEGEEHRQLENAFIQRTELKSDPVMINNLLFKTGAVHYATIKMQLYKQQALDILSEIELRGSNLERLKMFLE